MIKCPWHDEQPTVEQTWPIGGQVWTVGECVLCAQEEEELFDLLVQRITRA